MNNAPRKIYIFVPLKRRGLAIRKADLVVNLKRWRLDCVKDRYALITFFNFNLRNSSALPCHNNADESLIQIDNCKFAVWFVLNFVQSSRTPTSLDSWKASAFRWSWYKRLKSDYQMIQGNKHNGWKRSTTNLALT